MKSPQLLSALLLIALLSACTKESNEDLIEVRIQMSIPTAYDLHPAQGLLYQGAYLVWAESGNSNRLLVAYDLQTQTKRWEMDCNVLLGWGQAMLIEGDYLIADKGSIGFSVINLVNQEVVISYRYDTMPGFTSVTPPTIHDGKVYKGVYNPSLSWSTVLSVDIEEGTAHPEFQWLSDMDYDRKLATPLIYEAEGGALNLLMLMELDYRDADSLIDQRILLINGNNDYAVNWVDTLIPTDAQTPVFYLPVIIEDDLYVAHGDVVASYDIHNGARNWRRTLEWSNFPKLVVNEGALYLNTYSNFSKLDKGTGEVVWSQTLLSTPSGAADFSIYEDYLLYASYDFSPLILLDPNTGDYYEGDYSEVEQIANPLVYNNGALFVTHTIEDEVIGFVVE